MSRLPYPPGAWEVVKAREAGMRPAGPLIVVMTPKYKQLADDAHVYPEQGKDYDWRFIKGLSVVVVVDVDTKFGSLIELLDGGEYPGDMASQVDVIDCERKRGWHILAAKPGQKIKSCSWPTYWVEKWLTLECGPVDFSSV